MLIVGLGNPGAEYEKTRHNVGFRVVEMLAANIGVSVCRKGYKSLWGKGKINNKDIFLAKPQTFVNLSGESVLALLKGLNIDLASLLIVHDDLDLPFGEVRVKKSGGSGGHNGLRSIINILGTGDFGRIRIGIGRPPGRQDPAVYVLKPFTKAQREEVEFAVKNASDAALAVVKDGYKIAMNEFNRR